MSPAVRAMRAERRVPNVRPGKEPTCAPVASRNITYVKRRAPLIWEHGVFCYLGIVSFADLWKMGAIPAIPWTSVLAFIDMRIHIYEHTYQYAYLFLTPNHLPALLPPFQQERGVYDDEDTAAVVHEGAAHRVEHRKHRKHD